ncbi:MAG: hypothetical protein ACXU82_00035 [Caulobacteraceae bacterium]
MNLQPHPRYRGRWRSPQDVRRQVVCKHQVEIEVWPARAEVGFADDWTANPATTQVRFEAQVYNSGQGHTWSVRALDGSVGQGSVDASGLYRAPAKGSLVSGTTELVVATSREDPLRTAFAWVTLVGRGPRPAPTPQVTVLPRRQTLYYGSGANNDMIDVSNKRCEFQALAFGTASAVEWLVNGVPQGISGPWFLYQAPSGGGTATVTVTARLQANHAVSADAKISLLNYDWPGV